MKNFIILLNLFCCFAYAEWITIFDNPYTSANPISYSISSELLNKQFSQLRYYSVGGSSAILDAYLPNSSLQDHINQSWIHTGFESDYYKRLSVDTGSKMTSVFIGNDNDINSGGTQLAYGGTPFGLITLGYSENSNFIDGGDSIYRYNGMIYRLDINTVPEPSSLFFLSIALFFFIKKL